MNSLVVVLTVMAAASSPPPSERLLADVDEIREDVVLATPRLLRVARSLSRSWFPRPDEDGCGEPLVVSVRLTSESVWVGLRIPEMNKRIPHVDGNPDWGALGTALDEYLEIPVLHEYPFLEIAAHSDVTVETIARAWQVSLAHGFEHVGYTMPGREEGYFGTAKLTHQSGVK